MSSRVHSIAIYLMLFNLVLPVFAYAFIDISGSEAAGDTLEFITKDELTQAGVFLQTQERFELHFDAGSPIEFNASGRPVRVWWLAGGFFKETHFTIYKRSIFDVVGTWTFVDNLEVTIDGTVHKYASNYVRNETILDAYDIDYNWTRASVADMGIELFFTAEAAGGNMTQAIYDDGLMNVTLGTTIDYDDMDAGAFIDWYWGLLTTDSVYGLPIYIKWVFQIQVVLLIFTAVIIGRELTRV